MTCSLLFGRLFLNLSISLHWAFEACNQEIKMFLKPKLHTNKDVCLDVGYVLSISSPTQIVSTRGVCHRERWLKHNGGGEKEFDSLFSLCGKQVKAARLQPSTCAGLHEPRFISEYCSTWRELSRTHHWYSIPHFLFYVTEIIVSHQKVHDQKYSQIQWMKFYFFFCKIFHNSMH